MKIEENAAKSIEVDEWNGCYPSNWKGLIVPEAMAHPAKYSSKLIRKIYDHMRTEGWVKPGDTVIDPFGGVALGALDAMRLGLHWRGIELEPRFVRLGQGYDCPGIEKSEWVRWQKRLSRNPVLCPVCQGSGGVEYEQNSGMIPFKDAHHYVGNIELWNKKFSRVMPNWGDALLIPGDSRNLCGILEVSASVSSPPYADGSQHTGGNDPRPEKLEGGKYHGVGIAGSISSPPYAESVNSPTSGIDWEKAGRLDRERTSSVAIQGANSHAMKYGSTPGQLGAMKAKDFDAAVSSPPFNENRANAIHGETKGFHSYDENEAKNRMKRDYILPEEDGNIGALPITSKGFDAATGQLANESNDDFWIEARKIVKQVYLALVPGGHALWVVKDFVKNKQRVPFCDQWRELCESVGFTTLHEHHASLIRHRGTSLNFEGDQIIHQTSSKSFFRRLAEKKGSPPIDWEVVFCMVKE